MYSTHSGLQWRIGCGYGGSISEEKSHEWIPAHETSVGCAPPHSGLRWHIGCGCVGSRSEKKRHGWIPDVSMRRERILAAALSAAGREVVGAWDLRPI